MATNVLAPGVDSYDVHIGIWTNWAKGRIYGKTLTTTKQDGGLLIAFLALFVAAAGKSFWRISCLVMHRYLTSPESEDALHHQHQVVLRNAETPESAFWQFMVMARAWRKTTARPYRRLALFELLTITIFAGYNAAGLFSSQVTADNASEVLLTGKDCRAPWKPDNMSGSAFRQMYDVWGFRQNTANLNYAQKCYLNSDNEEDCRRYVKSKIDSQVTRNASCPFEDKLCKTGSIIVDTGLLNSNKDLGINMPSDSQFLIRSVSQCAPIISKGYTSTVNQSALPDVPLLRFHYGNFTYPNGSKRFRLGVPEFDYVEEKRTSKGFIYQLAANLSYAYYEGTDFQLRANARYDIGVQSLYSGDISNTIGFQMVSLKPELMVPDADVTLLFLSSEGVFYTSQIDDPWYSAHHIGKWAGSSDSSSNGTKIQKVPFYNQDETASVMGCTQQYQICDPNATNGTECSKLGGFNDVLNGFNETWGNVDDDRKKLMEWVYLAFQQGFISSDTVMDIAGQTALSAAYGLGWSINGPLPANQWEEEVLLWHSASTASLQSLFVEFANGPAILPKAISAPPQTEQGLKMCRNQRIMSTRFSSFSILGVALILALGGLLVITDLMLEPLLDFFQRRSTKHDHARLEWSTNAVLQLQRLAYEEAGSGTWTKCTDTVPITNTQEQLLGLDVSDRLHPRLRSLPKDIRESMGGAVCRQDTESTVAEKVVTRQDSKQTLSNKAFLTREDTNSPSPKSPLREAVVEVTEPSLSESPSTVSPVDEGWGRNQLAGRPQDR